MSISAGMVGVCLTTIGILKLVIHDDGLKHFGDDLLAVDSLLFLISCFVSFWVVKLRHDKWKRRLEFIAESMFLLGLTIMVVVCGLIAFAIA